jgi:hypothetical protein
MLPFAPILTDLTLKGKVKKGEKEISGMNSSHKSPFQKNIRYKVAQFPGPVNKRMEPDGGFRLKNPVDKHGPKEYDNL